MYWHLFLRNSHKCAVIAERKEYCQKLLICYQYKAMASTCHQDMPSVPRPSICSFLGCKNNKAFGTGYCHDHGAKRSDSYEENAKLYNSAAWRKKRIAMRSKYPICSACLLEGRVTQTEHIDHVVPHRRIPDRFLTNLFQGLCAPHHTIKTNLENKGVYRHYSENGIVDYNEEDYSLLMREKFHSERSHWAGEK